MTNPKIICSACKNPYPIEGVPYKCDICGGFFDYESPFAFDKNQIDANETSLWRYRSAFAFPPDAAIISLGEGHTPLVKASYQEQNVFMKLEYLNPTGSYKDRGSAILVSQLVARGITEAVEDSSGNAGASFAAYAARAGMHARIYVPESASGPKRTQIEMYGAELIRVPGARAAAAEAVAKEANRGVPYASHAYLPFGLAGISTIAYEIFEDLGEAPGTVIAPIGHGGLLLGIVRGFSALKNAGLIRNKPYYLGVQAKECSPMIERVDQANGELPYHGSGETIAEGVKVWAPVRGEALIHEIQKGEGEFIGILEKDITLAFHELSKMGFYVEPTSALAWVGYKMCLGKIPEPIIVILTGSGLKYVG